jgi:cation:H+ antiporter
MLVEVLTLLAIAVVATGVIWKGSAWLEHAAKGLSNHYGLPPVVQGAVVVAIGSSFPELSSAVIATVLHGSFDLGVSAIVGSAVFNLLVIPALAGLLTDGVESDRNLVYKEAQFYMIAVSALLITFALAVIYYPTGGDGVLKGEVTWFLALMPIGMYVVYVFTQWQDTADYDSDFEGEVNVLKEWALLLVSLAVIAAAVEGLIHAALGFGDLFNTPDFLWGLTVVAAGTSLPDALVSVRAAREGRGVTSLANVLGSNVFDLLVAVPAGVLAAAVVTGQPTEINFGVAVPLMGFLTVATVGVFALLRTDLTLSRTESAGLLAGYVGFVVWMVLETLDVTGFVPGA